MNISDVKRRIRNGEYNDAFSMLYTDISAAAERYIDALDEFCKLYGDRDNIRLFSAPGRTEVGGNHTDHQHGCVLAGSVDLDVIAKNTDGNLCEHQCWASATLRFLSLYSLCLSQEEKENILGKNAARILGGCQ